MENRKEDHLKLALQSQTSRDTLDLRFDYEPLLSSHPLHGIVPFSFLGKTFRVPLWVSSMTGGTELAMKINRNLASACNEFGFGMGLGSCRVILNDLSYLPDFDVRDIIGDDLPLFANLGISQVEQLIENNRTDKIHELVKRLRADGLIVHINPIQEWIQPEGNIIKKPPVETIKRLLDKVDFPLMVKEVGQGMGPSSLRELLLMPIAAIEFAAYGGTNFAEIENMRDNFSVTNSIEPISRVGMDAYQMLDAANKIAHGEKNILCKQLIISGGMRSYLDGYYFIRKSLLPAIYGQAAPFLKYAREDYDQLRNFIIHEIRGLEMAYAYLRLKEE